MSEWKMAVDPPEWRQSTCVYCKRDTAAWPDLQFSRGGGLRGWETAPETKP